MAKTGYVINQGIQQVFTSGPFSGSLVTSSYSLNNSLVGPIIDTRQSFISGTLDIIYNCSSIYNRYFLPHQILYDKIIHLIPHCDTARMPCRE